MATLRVGLVIPLALVGATFNAGGQSLNKTNKGAPHPLDFAIYADRSQPNTFVYAPLRLEVAQDPESKQKQIGLQYFQDQQSKLTKLSFTASLKFSADHAKLADLLEWAKGQKGATAKVAVMSGASAECSPYVILPGGELVARKASSSGITFDSNLQVSASFDFISKKDLGDVLKGAGTIGVFCQVFHQQVSEVVQEVIAMPEELNLVLKSFTWLSLDIGTDKVVDAVLDKKLDQANELYRQMARPNVIEWVNSISGKPIPTSKFYGRIEWGWNLTTQTVQDKVKKIGALKFFASDQYTYKPVKYSISSFDDVCRDLSKQIVNLDTGETGCDDLK